MAHSEGYGISRPVSDLESVQTLIALYNLCGPASACETGLAARNDNRVTEKLNSRHGLQFFTVRARSSYK